MQLVKNKILNKTCIFICFADNKIGSGHLFRCQILAAKFKEKGWDVYLFGPNLDQKKNIKTKLFKKIFFYDFKNKYKLSNISKKKFKKKYQNLK